MDLRNNARPSEQAAQTTAPVSHAQHHVGAGGFLKPSLASKILVVLLIVVSVLVILAMGMRVLSAATSGGAVKGKQYQALFLTNGQVYFGKLSKVDDGYVKLTDIYYLQVQQQVQPKPNQPADQQQPQISLAKLGGELHGPEDIMYVSRQQVLFWENLKDDGKVVKAIKEFQTSGNK
jgi:hypothetical protein